MIALLVALLVLGALLGWQYLRRRRRNQTGCTTVDAGRPRCALPATQPGSAYDLLLVHLHAEGSRQFAQWLEPELRIRVANDAEEAVDRLIDQRPDIMWMALETEATAGLMLTRQLRKMQADAFEPPSWIVALTDGVPSMQIASDAGVFDQVLPQPRSREACFDTFRANVKSMPATSGRPWIQQATELAMPGFLASRQQLAEAIDRAVQEGRFGDAAKSAHTLAGSPGMHDFEYGVAACRYIERHHASASAAELAVRAKELRDLLAQIELR